MIAFDRLQRFFSRKATAMTSQELLRQLQAGSLTASGQSISHSSSLQVSVVLACTRVLADGVAQVPVKLMQKVKGGADPAEGHWASDLVSRRASEEFTSFEWRETVMIHLALTGVHHSLKLKVGSEVRELLPLLPGSVELKRNPDGTRSHYVVSSASGSRLDVAPENMLELRGPVWDPATPLDPVRLAREAIGLAMASESHSAQLQSNKVTTSGVYSVEGSLSEAQYKAIRKYLKDFTTSGGSAGEPFILDRSAKFLQTAIAPVDAQHIETRHLQIEEICRFFRVMPIMIGHPDKTATYASSEQMFLAHVVHTLMPWYVRLEQRLSMELLTPQEQDSGLYIKFFPNGLMRGAMKERGEFYARALGSGGSRAWMTPDEVRAKEDMNEFGGDASQLDPPDSSVDPEPSTGLQSPAPGSQDSTEED